MLGFADGWVTAAYYLCLASTFLCIIYGIAKWKGMDEETIAIRSTDDDLDV